MEKQVKKIGKYYIYKQNKVQKNEVCQLYEGKHIQDNFPVMIYQINRNKIDMIESLTQQFKRKVSLLRQVKSRVFHKCHQISVTHNHYYVVLQQIREETLQKKLKSQGLTQDQLVTFLIAIREMTQQMRKANYFHGHLSPKVINMSKTKAKIQPINLESFDLFTKLNNYNQFSELKIIDNESLVYYPPEVIREKRFTQKTDCWAIGVLLYQTVYGKFPWNLKNASIHQFITKTVYQDIYFPQNSVMTKQLSYLLFGCLKADQDLRFCLDDVLAHQIFKLQQIKSRITSNQDNENLQQQESLSSMKTQNEYSNPKPSMIRKN